MSENTITEELLQEYLPILYNRMREASKELSGMGIEYKEYEKRMSQICNTITAMYAEQWNVHQNKLARMGVRFMFSTYSASKTKLGQMIITSGMEKEHIELSLKLYILSLKIKGEIES